MYGTLNKKAIEPLIKDALTNLGNCIKSLRPTLTVTLEKDVFLYNQTHLKLVENKLVGKITTQVVSICPYYDTGQIECLIDNTGFAAEAKSACEELSKKIDWPFDIKQYGSSLPSHLSSVKSNSLEEKRFTEISEELNSLRRETVELRNDLANSQSQNRILQLEKVSLKAELEELKKYKKERNEIMAALNEPVRT